MPKKKEPTIRELYRALNKLGFEYQHAESHEGLEVVNFLVRTAGVSKKPTKKESEVK
jgi:hypothetical protein